MIFGSIGGMWKSFWHTMTSYDRHASHNSPYRTGQRPDSRHAPLTSIATNTNGSRTELSSQETSELTNGYPHQPTGNQSPSIPYAPGSRSTLRRTQTDDMKIAAQSQAGEIQMQNFTDGLPPPPPVSHSWQRIDRWAESTYEELFDNLCEGCTQNDINELEHQLDCTLPLEVRDSLQLHDGQERGGLPTGIIFGCMLLDCEEIVQEWQNWRQVNEQYLAPPTAFSVSDLPPKAFAAGSSSQQPAKEQTQSTNWREVLLSRQDSQPSNAVQKAYAHPGWIPLARDWGGNCLAVDLAPGPAGKWGQIIVMGRDYDCKYVIARSWAAFLANLADDITSKKVIIIEDSGELRLEEFKEQGVNPPYLEILRWRADQKYGRKGPKRRGNASGNANGAARPSPYNKSGEPDRGRSPQRANGKAPEKRGSHNHVPSPLAQGTAEHPKLQTTSGVIGAPAPLQENLISPMTPTLLEDPHSGPPFHGGLSQIGNANTNDFNKENGRPVSAIQGLGVKLDDSNASHDAMTTVDI